MCASSTRGFTLPELVAVLLLLSVLAVTAMPKLDGVLSLRDDGWRDQIVAALRLARQSAVGHRRLVCAQVDTTGVALTIAAANPASSCSAALRGADGSSYAALRGSAAAVTVSPAGTLYFQPSGRVTGDGAGSSAATRTLTIAGQASIVVVGETGHVE